MEAPPSPTPGSRPTPAAPPPSAADARIDLASHLGSAPIADVVVVGARVAGASTAMLLARAGLDVVLVDRTRQPSDTLSTHAIARGGVVQLTRWGVLDAVHATGAPAIRQVSFHRGTDQVRRTVKVTAGVDHLLAPRRHALDPVLVDAAVAAGVRLLEGVTVSDVVGAPNDRAGGVVVHGPTGASTTISARHVVGADGLRSTVARQVSAPVVSAWPSRTATHYRYVAGLDGAGIEYHLGGGAFAGVFPTNDGEACVWVCSPSAWIPRRHEGADGRRALFDGLLARVSPALAVRVQRATATSPVRGASDLPNQVRRGSGPGWWLVGDAGAHRDPITGHGITDALRDAELLAEAILTSASASGERAARAGYEACRRAAIDPIFHLTCELASFPDEETFGLLQRELSGLLEAEATALHERGPRPWTRSGVAV